MNTELIDLAREIGLHPILIFLVVLMMPVFFKIENFIQYYDNIKSRKLQKIQQAMSCEDMPDLEINYLKSLNNNELFKQATGIFINHHIRSHVIKFSNDLSISHKDLKIIQNYFKKQQNNIIIDITKYEWCFLFLSKWVFLLSVLILTIMVVILIMSIDFILGKSDIIKSIFQLFIIYICILLMYFKEARTYIIFCNIYDNNHNVFKIEMPNKYWKIGSILVFCLIIFATSLFKI
ncbi:MAG: hypothetical protein Q3971_08895 [Moraxella sp.]|nr:hypothetical protein [Moraxella sp.]